ncbi:MAG: DNA ligase D [Ramlibacter sp.]|nr:DNA ligase D [Ramlibacter sp.]
MAQRDKLQPYRDKRNFALTPEPAASGPGAGGKLTYVIQKHWASHLHYDLRLELDGTLKSWAVPKGPSLDPADKRMAVQVEDHPLAYGDFEGSIPKGQYGGGDVIVWDRGTWVPHGDPRKAWRAGKLKFELRGEKLHGHWTLVRMRGKETDSQPAWLLIKEADAAARTDGYDITRARPASVLRAAPARPHGKRKGASAVLPAEARAARLPVALAPQLATLAAAPPDGAQDWLYEAKLDGYRLLARVDAGKVKLFTRNGHDWTQRLPELARAVTQLPLRSGWLDGEIVVPGANDAPDFQALQAAFEGNRREHIVYYLFDLPYYAGHDLRAVPLDERRTLLKGLFIGQTPAQVRFSESFDVPPHDLLAAACRLGLEGVIGKRRDAPYVSQRSADWIKLKCTQRQEFVVVGYTDPQGTREGLGALLLAVHDRAGQLRYAGNVGSGFTDRQLVTLEKQLTSLHAPRSALPPTRGLGPVHWVRPELLAEVSFGEWTRSGRIRQAVFRGLREDKKPQAIVREQPLAPQRLAAATRARKGPVLTHPGRVIDPASGTTKGELADYYARAAALILPHLKDRPVALVRAPGGVTQPLFFQKHADDAELPGVRRLDPSLDPGHEPLLAVAGAQALQSLAQMNVVELHTWNATARAIDRPDRMTFDLDPGEGTPWIHVQQGAQLVQVALQELGLPAFLKTSGGKGLHVVVPLRRHYGWEAVKGFSQAIVQHLAATLPERFVAKSGPRNRVGKIFVDYLRNGFGATTVSAWSVRARAGLGVSVPVAWSELGALTGGAHWTLANIAPRLATGNQPWAGYHAARKGLSAAMKQLGFQPGAA